MSQPLVSILIPCFNAAPWLAETIESALAQTWSSIEIIVVDDGSSDQSLAIARRFESRGVTVLTQKNAGASAARNHALRHACGEFIQYLDADDLLAPDKIEHQVKCLLTNPPFTIASGAWARFETNPATAVFSPGSLLRNLSGVEYLQLHYETGDMMQPAAWLCPHTVLKKAGPWNESLSLNDDGEYFARVVLASSGIQSCAQSRVYYRSGHASRLSGRTDLRAMTSLFQSVELTVGHLLASDTSPRSFAAAAYAWKWTAFELYPAAPALSHQAEAASLALGGSERPHFAGRRFRLAALIVGWRLAKRWFY